MTVARSAPVGGFALAYERAGSGTPVLVLHGWPGDRDDFAAVTELLMGRADVVRPDLRGFGASDKHTGGDYSAAGQVASVLGLLDELGIEQAVVAGYDVGSRVGQSLARDHADRVLALVITPPLPGAGRRVLEPLSQREFWYQSFHQLDLAEQLIDGQPDAVRAYLLHFWTHWSGPDFTPSPARLDSLVSRYGAPGAFAASIGWYRAGSGMVATSLAEQPPPQRITVPTTALWPEHDPLFPPTWGDRLDEWFTDLDLRPVEGVGHFVPIEAPDTFAAAIAEHL